MLSRKLKINLSNPCLGLLPTLILMLTDTVLGKFEAYLAGIITSCCINFYLYFFARDKFVSWYMISSFIFFILSYFVYDFISEDYRFIRSEILVAAYFLLLLPLKKPLKMLLLGGKNSSILGYRENINALFLLKKNVLIFLLCYISCYLISRNLGVFGENDKGIYQLIEMMVLFVLFLFATFQMDLYRVYFTDEKYVAIINNDENVIGYESFNLVVGNKSIDKKEKNKHIKLRIMAIYDGKLMLKQENGIWDLYYHDYLLYGENYESCLKRIVGSENFHSVKFDEKYNFTMPREDRLTLLHTLVLNNSEIENLNSEEYKFWPADQLRLEMKSSIFSPQLQRDLEVHLARLEATFSLFSDNI